MSLVSALTKALVLLVAGSCLEFTLRCEAFPSPVLKTRTRNLSRASPLFSSPNTAADTTPPSESSAVPKKTYINGATPQQSKFPSRFSVNVGNFMDRIRQISNFASFLCVLDCTILPIITVVLPLLGVLNLGASQMEVLHELGHSLALFFVLPVGSLTAILNYLSHRKMKIASMALTGLVMVGMANSHIHLSSAFPQWASHTLRMIQHGPWHRVVNISGCAFLLGSNYLSQQQGCAHHDHGSSCSHDHSDDHHSH